MARLGFWRASIVTLGDFSRNSEYYELSACQSKHAG